MTFNVFTYATTALSRFKLLNRSNVTSFVTKSAFLSSYYRLNNLMWQDGLLVDFLQKKVVDKWIRRFLVCSSYLFSERVLFAFVVRFYIDFVVWPSTASAPFDFSSVSALLTATLAALIAIILLFNINYLYWAFL